MWDCINLHSCQSDVVFFIFDTLPCIFCKPKFLLNKVKISGLCRHFLQMMTIWVFKQGTRIYSETQWSNKTIFRWLVNDRRIFCVYSTRHLGKLADKAKLFTIYQNFTAIPYQHKKKHKKFTAKLLQVSAIVIEGSTVVKIENLFQIRTSCLGIIS